ncbi:MAG TPA: AfsR/SARP family transcriptional regulator [Pilimelia sp.]|nr:AfsR/SARP family transcriptional regulator [Pilimelia sp.]
MDLRISVLGPVEVTVEGCPRPLPHGGARVIFALLALNKPHVVGVAHFVEALWEEHPPPSAATRIQSHVSAIRRTLGCRSVAHPHPGCPVETGPRGYRLVAGASDLDRFRTAVVAARALRAAHATPATRLNALAGARALWTGEPCVDVGSVAVRNAAAPLVDDYLDVVEEWAELSIRLGSYHEVVAALRGLVARYPAREHLCGSLMAALAASGRVAEALATYRASRARLTADLGIEPSERLQRLHNDLLNGVIRPLPTVQLAY